MICLIGFPLSSYFAVLISIGPDKSSALPAFPGDEQTVFTTTVPSVKLVVSQIMKYYV